MKKLLILLIFLSSPGLAQRFKAELMASVVGSQVSGDNLQGFNKAGFMGGAGVRTFFNDKWSLGFRVAYFQKGSRKPLKGDGTDSAFYLLRLGYVEMPLMLRYKSEKNFFVEAGPSLGYLLSSYEEDENGPLNLRIPFYDFDLSLAGSLGYHLNNNLDFLFSYWQSIIPIREHTSGAVYRLNQGQYSSVISFGLIYTFQKKTEANPE
jgi:hypothetical protein